MQRLLRILLVIILGALSLPLSTFAATLSLSPASPTVNAGDIVTVRLLVNTQGVPINQGEGTLRFPTDMLEVVSASKASSIFTLWVEEPSYSNQSGTVSFDGGLPTPGYTGSSGTVLSITFLAKKKGTATLSLSESAIRANDGLGTDVLSYAGGSTITITDTTTAPSPSPSEAPQTPSAPASAVGEGAITNLTSTSHSNQDAWYQNTSPLMTWVLPKGATAIQTIVDKDKNATPSVTYKPAIVERRISGLEDGIWYFNIRARIGTTWGPVSSYTLRIDTTAPQFTKTPTVTYDAAQQRIVLSDIAATDTTSGLNRYEVHIDGGEPSIITPESIVAGSATVPFKTAGTHTLIFRAVDYAGNQTETASIVNVPTPLADQVLWSIGSLAITFGSFALLILLITLIALIAAITAWYKLYILKAGAKSRIEKRDKLLHRSLRIYKEELERHLRTLERAGTKRELTDEEADLNEDLKKNVDDLERYLAKEFKKFD